jgi:hypothetical protein
MTLLALRDGDQSQPVLMHGGAATDATVHLLDLDRAAVGPSLSAQGIAHDWLAVLDNARDLSLVLPAALVSGTAADDGLVSVPVLPRSFITVASALLFLQEDLQSNAGHLTVLSTAGTRAPPALRSLSTVQLRINVTIAGSDASSELACADEDTECALYIGGTLMASSDVSGRNGRSTRVRLLDLTFRGGRGNYGGALFASAAWSVCTS